jgi:hypothetical protein
MNPSTDIVSAARTLAAPDPGGATVDGRTGANALYAVLSADWTPEAPLSLLFLHGYGASEQDLAALGPMLALTVPWASLRGPAWAPAGGGTPGSRSPRRTVPVRPRFSCRASSTAPRNRQINTSAPNAPHYCGPAAPGTA